jgi:hypothetical protein
VTVPSVPAEGLEAFARFEEAEKVGAAENGHNDRDAVNADVSAALPR